MNKKYLKMLDKINTVVQYINQVRHRDKLQKRK